MSSKGEVSQVKKVCKDHCRLKKKVVNRISEKRRNRREGKRKQFC